MSDKDFIVYNSDYFWIFNLENKTYYKEKYEFLNEDPENYYTLSLEVYDRQFAYLEPNDTEVIVHTFTLEDVTN